LAKYTIRTMRLDDIDAVVDIQKALVKRNATRRWRKALKNYIETEPKACLVATVKGKPIGFIIGDVKTWGFGMRQSGWFEIIGIHPKHMGTGVGRDLGKRLLRYFRSKQVDGIYTAVRWDSGDLLSFFKSIGFEHSGFLNLEHSGSKR